MIQSLPNPTKDKGSNISYKHLTLQGRYQINAYRYSKNQKEIADILGVHPSTISTISRELKRGRGRMGKDYWPIYSQEKGRNEKSVRLNYSFLL